MLPVNRNPNAKTLRSFGVAMLFGFGVIGAILWYTGSEPNGFNWRDVAAQKVAIALWVLGVLLAIIAVGPRSLSAPIYIAWMTVGMFLGAIMTFIMMSVLFVVLLPIFSLIRLKDPLRMKLKPPGESYWEDHRDHEPTLERTARPF
ncbi:MAG TPA: hypothetical protein PKN33_11765 [Phycisphaerae bacterium]|nr:hypothetical protein [Phycisphaerales bacterium]HNO78728.1 hypothetical protein [Phycisphaerae bacterium]